VQIRPIVTNLQATLTNQAAVSGDPAVDTAVAHLVEALGPALHVAAMEIAEQAAAEVGAQLPDHEIAVVLADGDPALRVHERPATTLTTSNEDLDARLTLRLTPTLKQLVEEAAQNAGDSINAWVAEALGKQAGRQRTVGKRVTESFDL
jgi:hypothetical protein